MYKKVIQFVLSLGLTMLPFVVNAQCAMCKASAETSMDSGSKNIAGINNGIIYLLSAPYILVGVVGFVWYRSRQKSKS